MRIEISWFSSHGALLARKRRLHPESPASLKRKCLEAVLTHREILLAAANPFTRLSNIVHHTFKGGCLNFHFAIALGDSLKKELLQVVMVPLADNRRLGDMDEGQVHDANQLQLLHLLLNEEVDGVEISLEAYSADFQRFWMVLERVRPPLQTLDVRKRRVATSCPRSSTSYCSLRS
jgi:hypothetical protein